ncbi:MAG: HAMP domain-containing protein [Candidatus Methanoperedens sp.]|nr:HAMP domain-containing protein [Candidatus Methanoperedens sp.]
MKIVYKLTLGFVLISLLVGFIAYIGYIGAISAKMQYDQITYETLPIIDDLYNIKLSILSIVDHTNEILFTSLNDPDKPGKETREIAHAIEAYNRTFEHYEFLTNKYSPEEEEIVKKIKTNGEDIKRLSSELIFLKDQGNNELKISEKQRELNQVEIEFLKNIDYGLKHEQNELNERTNNTNNLIQKIVFQIIVFGFISFVLAISIGLFISNRLSFPIVKLKNASNEIGKGNLETIIDINTKDEIEELGHAFNKMTHDLKMSLHEQKIANEQIQKSLQEKEVLLREIHHRVKNNMQIISSLLLLSSQNIEDKKFIEILADSQSRINSMALIHEKLYQSENLGQINFNEYINDMASNLLNSYGKGNVKLEQDVENCPINIDSGVTCGLIINELITNSLKYAFPDGRKGIIKIVFKSIGSNRFQLSIKDDGIGIPKDLDIRKTKSLGLHLVTALAENQLQGELILNRDRGTEFQINFKGV